MSESLPRTLRAPGKLNLCLYVGPDARRRAARDRLGVRAARAVRRAAGDARADGDEVVLDGIEAPDLTARALAALRESGWDSPPLRIEVREADAGRGRAGRRQRRRRRRAAAGDAGRSRDCAGSRPGSAPTCPRSSSRAPAWSPAPARWSSRSRRPADHGVVLVPQEEGLSTAEVYAEADRLGVARGSGPSSRRSGGSCATRSPRARSPLDYPEHLINDLQPAAHLAAARRSAARWRRSGRPGPAHAMVTGSGPTAFGLFPPRGRGRRGRVASRALPGRARDGPGAPVKSRSGEQPLDRARDPDRGCDRGLPGLPRPASGLQPRGDDQGPLRGARLLDLPAGRRARLPRDRRLRRAGRAGRVHGDPRRRRRRAGGHLAAADPRRSPGSAAFLGDTVSFIARSQARPRLPRPARRAGADHRGAAASRSRATSRATAARRS